MRAKKLWIGAAIAVVASAALLVPSIASGAPLAPFFPVSAVVMQPGDEHDDGPGNNGRGNAFGHDKDSDDFPGNNGRGNGNGNGSDKHEDGPGNNGRGNAFGHDKDSDDFPGNNGRGQGNPHDDDDE